MTTMRFESDGTDWSAWLSVTRWLDEHGYSYGDIQRDAPVGVIRGAAVIGKWRNLSTEERAALVGRIDWPPLALGVPGGPRTGPAVLTLFAEVPDAR